MRHRTLSRKTAKTRHRRTTKATPSGASRSTRSSHSSVVDLQEKLDRQTRELNEAHEQQAATLEVLEIIGHSTFELQPVLESLLEKAVRLCGADRGLIFRQDADVYRVAASCGHSPEFLEKIATRYPITQDGGSATGRAVVERRVVHIHDILADPGYQWAKDHHGEEEMHRTILAAPMMRQGKIIGVITIRRVHVQPFTDRQIALVSSFAAQAVIAIENARLLNELRESLQQQTATADVLKIISRSTFDLQTVLNTLVESAARLCEAEMANIWRPKDGVYRLAASYGVTERYREYVRNKELLETVAIEPRRGTVVGRTLLEGKTVHVHDLRADPDFNLSRVTELGDYRSTLGVPLLRQGVPIGVIVLTRTEVRPFTEKQIELVSTFADQAVIAIENVRLFEAEQQRTRELTESLKEQTATSEVLRVISSSPGELEPVFKSMLENAVRVCGAKFGMLHLSEGDGFRTVAMHDVPREFAEKRGREPFFSSPAGSPMGRVARTRQVAHIADITTEKGHGEGDRALADLAHLGGARTLVAVPMFKENDLVGAIVIYRQEVRPFSEKQIELLKNFASQAVIVIENTRLLNELRQSLQQQTATADVLKVISRSTFDLQTVLDTLTESAARLCDADVAAMHRQQGKNYQVFATYGSSPEHRRLILSGLPFEAGRGSVLGRTVLERKPIQVADVIADPDYSLQEIQKTVGFRTVLGVPMLREGNPIGAVVLMRLTVRPFTDRQIELAQTFADQAGIAIENVRLFDEIQDKSRQLEEASQHKSQFLANMSHELRTPLNAILGYTELMADGAYGEPSEKMLGILQRLEANGRHLLGLINDVLDLSKIEAGQLELELSDYTVQDIAQTVRSTLEPLAADKKLAFKVEVAPKLPSGRGDGRRLTQVLINLVGNAIKFTDAGAVAIEAEAKDGSFYVSVRDTGPGISTADQAKLFQEFQQADNAITKKKGGTGLGLAISKRIIEMHGGKIWVELQLGQGSTFAFKLPVIVEQQVETAA